jgi:predicted DNA-binding transcriptional regulator AlpA
MLETKLKPDRIRSRREVCELLGISLSTLSRLEKRGDFPSRTQLSERRYGYRDSAISQFIAERST